MSCVTPLGSRSRLNRRNRVREHKTLVPYNQRLLVYKYRYGHLS